MKKIIVIEDEEIIRDNIVSLLEFSGYNSIGATNGQDGLEQIRKIIPDLIICDIAMPYMNGHEVLEEIRRDPAIKTIPFIFLTAKSDRSSLRKGFEHGADDYITKPYTVEELLSAIEARFERQDVVTGDTQKRMRELQKNLTRSLPHEFRTPLTSILGLSHLLIDEYGTIPEKHAIKMLKTIHQSAERLNRLVQNYLLYAELEILTANDQKCKELREHYIQSSSSITRYIAMREAQKAHREQDLNLEIQNAIIQISEENYAKILEELIDNALKFSEPGTPIHIKTILTERHFILEISDQGRGMTREQIAQIGAYFQFERKHYEQKGTGLGLALAKNIVELHGGTLTIESIPHQQTTIQVKLNYKKIKET